MLTLPASFSPKQILLCPEQLSSLVHPIAPQMIWFRAMWCILVATVFSRVQTILSANQTALTTGNDLHDMGQCCLCPASPSDTTSCSKVLRALTAPLGIQRDHPSCSGLPLPPPSSNWILTAAEPAPSLFPSWPLVPQPSFSRERSINTSQSHSQFCQIHARKSLFTIPSLCLIYFYPYPSLHIMKLIRDIYFAWPGTKVELEVWVVQQHKAEMSSLKHHKHFKAEEKSIWECSMKIMELGEIKQFPIFEMTCQNTKQWGGQIMCYLYAFRLWHLSTAEYSGKKHDHYICSTKMWAPGVLHWTAFPRNAVF